MKIRVPIQPLFGTVVFIVFTLGCSLTATSQTIDFGKSYINVTKGLNGGTVEPGDTLEIRASLVISSGTYDSCSFSDFIPAGTTYIPGTIRVLTNEGKIYKQFTDAVGDDPGWISSGNVRINFGYTTTNFATAFRKGRVSNNNKPSFYGSTCIMIAAFRVIVNTGYSTTISLGGGSMTYKASGARNISTYTFPGRQVAVYRNIGICPNAIGANSLGTEFNGTFGSGKPRNRGTSANVPTGYTYATFGSNSPQDYYYGIANNTSINTGYTTSNAWPKPDNVHRVFGVWDVIGDHTGASNPTLGNPAADTVANSNAGYMLVINAAYRIDSAFQQTISGLCPNTYYEISLWLRNICSRCGCDSNGVGASGAGYLPTAANDSSGVYPNLSFNVDGIDYYTTGNITYSGTWIKKGFTFLTGQNQTSFTMKVFNNAPGGGGNDWALDDISVATCSPNLAFTPNNNPVFCQGNVVDLGAYIRSYFNNYTYYKWQKSTDNGLTYTDAGPVQTGSPQWNGSSWEYYTAYPQFISSTSDSGNKYRVVVASTSANINSANCSFADATSVLTVNVKNCGKPLSTDILSFTAKAIQGAAQLNWTTTREEPGVQYAVEKSIDGTNFTIAGRINASGSGAETNYYNWSEPYGGGQPCFYRIRLIAESRQKLSRTAKVFSTDAPVNFVHVPNPFYHQLTAEIITAESQVVQLQLIDNLGKVVLRQQTTLMAGNNNLRIDQTESLPKGLYTLQLQSGDAVVSKKVVKM